MEDKEILISGNLHIYNALWTDFKADGVVVHVEGDVFVHQEDDDFTYPKTDTFIENLFEKYDVKDIIYRSPKFKSNQ